MPTLYIIDMEKYEEIERQLELKDEQADQIEEDFVNETIQCNKVKNNPSITNESTVIQSILRTVFISYITYGKLEYLCKKFKI